MKYIKYILIAAVAMFASCGHKDGDLKVTSADGGTFDGTTLTLDGSEQIVVLKVSGGDFQVASPSQDLWLSCYKVNGKLGIRVSINTEDFSRESAAIVYNGASSVRIPVIQEGYKYFRFPAGEGFVDAAAGSYKVAASTNISDDKITVSTDASWMSNLRIENGWLQFDAEANETGSSRRAEVKGATDTGVESTVTVIQPALEGKPYIIPLGSADLEAYPVYDVYDGTTLVARICKEYLYKLNTNGTSSIDGSYTVVYPVKDGELNYSNGLIADNGGMVCWASGIDAETKGYDMIAAAYPDSKTPSGTNVYIPKGASTPRLEPLTDSDMAEAVTATLSPVILVDTRSGNADSQGGTTESFTYTAVKIGSQYWARENFKAARYNDGSLIPTGISRENWQAMSAADVHTLQPLCMISHSGSGNNNIDDAANPSYQSSREANGLHYTFAALWGVPLNLESGKPASVPSVERLSPEGWAVPSSDDFRQLVSYTVQYMPGSMTNKEVNNELKDKLEKSASNVTGFSAVGGRQVGSTGGYNGYTYYHSTDYVYRSGHYSAQLRLYKDSSYYPVYEMTMYVGTYIRLIKR